MNLLGVDGANCCVTLIGVGAHGHENDNSVLVTLVLERCFVLVTEMFPQLEIFRVQA